MPAQLNIKRQLAESGDAMYINRWWTGLVTSRSPLFVPVSSLGLQVISRHDSLWDGKNIEISPNATLVRRPGHSRYCAAALSGETAQKFFSFKDTNGTVRPIVDTTTRVATFDTTSITSLYTKGTTQQTSFVKVGDVVYMYDGTNAKRWDGTHVNDIGITAPVTAPTLSFAAGTLSPKSGYKYVYCYRRSTTGEVSTASPASASTLALTSQQITVSGASHSDPTVDKVDIFRTLDGGSGYYFLTTVDNGGTWSFIDTLEDTDVNDDIAAPLAHLNDPPPAGASLACFHMGRVWLAAGNKLYFGAGPQVTYGVPESCFPPANVFVLPGHIKAMASTSAGLAVWTENDFYLATGSDLADFVVRRYQANFGVMSQNCVQQDGDLLFVFTTSRQLFKFSDALEEVGYPIRNLLGAMDPTSVRMSLHRSGTDEGLFVSDGAGTIFRYSVAQNCWCTKAVVANAGCLDSIEVATADYRLLVGAGTRILARDLSVFSDDGLSYSADVTVGTLMLAPPGQTATVEALLLETMPVGTYPTVSILANEISGTFITLPDPKPDPPGLPATTTVLSKRHYLAAAQTPIPRQMRYLLARVEFAQEAEHNELLGLSISG